TVRAAVAVAVSPPLIKAGDPLSDPLAGVMFESPPGRAWPGAALSGGSWRTSWCGAARSHRPSRPEIGRQRVSRNRPQHTPGAGTRGRESWGRGGVELAPRHV